METTEIAVLASIILLITQTITLNFPTLNRMWVTLIVTAVVGTVGYFVQDSITFMTVIQALAAEVLGYNIVAKGVIKPLRK
jgi:hypothetical protein